MQYKKGKSNHARRSVICVNWKPRKITIIQQQFWQHSPTLYSSRIRRRRSYSHCLFCHW